MKNKQPQRKLDRRRREDREALALLEQGQSSTPKSISTSTSTKSEDIEQDILILQAVDECHGSLYKAYQKTGIAMSTIHDCVQRAKRERGWVVSGLREYTRERHEELLKDRILGSLEHADPSAPKDMYFLAGAHERYFNCLQLLNQQPTEIHGVMSHKRVEILHLIGTLGDSLPQDVVIDVGKEGDGDASS